MLGLYATIALIAMLLCLLKTTHAETFDLWGREARNKEIKECQQRGGWFKENSTGWRSPMPPPGRCVMPKKKSTLESIKNQILDEEAVQRNRFGPNMKRFHPRVTMDEDYYY